MWLLAAALADEPYVEPTRFAVAAGLGGSWLVGGNGEGFGFAASERVAIETRFNTANAVTARFRHAHHVLRDGGVWFEVPVTDETIAGGRDYVLVDVGVRVGADIVDELAIPATRARVYPGARFAGGVAWARSRLDVAALDGRAEIDSGGFLPLLGVDFGAEIRLRRAISLFPSFSTSLLFANDVGELDGRSNVGVEARFEPALDLMVGF